MSYRNEFNNAEPENEYNELHAEMVKLSKSLLKDIDIPCVNSSGELKNICELLKITHTFTDKNITLSKARKIALIGFKRSGKDTVAKFLEETIFNCFQFAIASSLKSLLLQLFPNLTEKDLEEDKEKIQSYLQTTPRILMQTVGTEMFQTELAKALPWMGKTFWIRALLDKLNEYDNINQKTIIITDLRFIHEYNVLIEKYPDLIVIKIENEKNDPIDLTNIHISETEHLDIHAKYTISNSGNFDELYQKVIEVIDDINKST